MNTRADTIQRKLADTDRHAADPLVADAEDRLVVGDNHQAHAVEGRGRPQYRLDASTVFGRDENAARTTINMGKIPRGLTDGRRVDDRHQGFEISAQHLVEQDLVTVQQQRQVDVLPDRVRIKSNRPELPFGLCLDVVVFRRQQGVDAELPPFLERKAEPFVVQRVTQQLGAADRDVDAITVRGALDPESLHPAESGRPSLVMPVPRSSTAARASDCRSPQNRH